MGTDASPELVRVQGTIVEKDALRIAEQVTEYDPNLRVQYLDPDYATSLGDAPYQVIELCRDGIDRVVFSVWTLDGRVLDRIREIDNQRHNVSEILFAHNAKLRQEAKRKGLEVREEKKDVISHIVKSPLCRYTVKLRDRLVRFE